MTHSTAIGLQQKNEPRFIEEVRFIFPAYSVDGSVWPTLGAASISSPLIDVM